MSKGILDKVNQEMFDEDLKSGLRGRWHVGDLQRWGGSRADIQPRLCSLEQFHHLEKEVPLSNLHKVSRGQNIFGIWDSLTRESM